MAEELMHGRNIALFAATLLTQKFHPRGLDLAAGESFLCARWITMGFPK
jgi:hypothetical protein